MGRRLLAAVLVLAMSGCSFASVRQVTPGETPQTCSTSNAAPAADVVLALPSALGMVLGLSLLQHGTSKAGNAGLVIGVPSLLIFTLSIASARHGFSSANRCRTARLAAAQADLEAVRTTRQRERRRRCQATFTTIAAGRVLAAKPMLPRCPITDAELAISTLGSVVTGDLGELGHVRAIRVTQAGPTGTLIRVWIVSNVVVAVEIVQPQLPAPWPLLREDLGEPDDQLPYRDERLDLADGQWVYADRGLAVIVTAEATVDRILLFPPTTPEGFRKHLALGQ